jgi:hypothetical protein
MAHVREEFALGPTRGLGGQLGALQLRLGLPPRGDVDGDPEDAAAPALDEDRRLGRLQPACPALAGEGLLGDEHRLPAIDHALVVLEEALDFGLGKPETLAHLLVGHADYLLRGQSVDVRHGLVGQDPVPVAVLDEDVRGARVDHRLEQGVKLPPLLGGLPMAVQLLLEMPERRGELLRPRLNGLSGVDQALLHVIEGRGEPPQLVAGVDVDSLAEVAVGDPHGALMETVDPRGDMPGNDERDADAQCAE